MYESPSLDDLDQIRFATEQPETWLYAANAIRRLISTIDPPTQQVIDSGFLAPLVEWVKNFDFPQLQFESAWALGNIASGTSAQVAQLVEAGALVPIVQLLKSKTDCIKETAALALGNIASDCFLHRDMLLAAEGHKYLADAAQSTPVTDKAMLNIAWALSNICRMKPIPGLEIVQCIVPAISPIYLETSCNDVLVELSWALAFLSREEKYIDLIVEQQVYPKAIQLMMHENTSIQLASVRFIGELSGEECLTQLILDCGVLDSCKVSIRSPKKHTVKDTLWLISNIAAGTESQAVQLIQSGLVQAVIDVGLEGDAVLLIESCYVIGNLANYAAERNLFDLASQALRLLILGLENNLSTKQAAVVLEGIEGWLSIGNTFGEFNPFIRTIQDLGGLEILKQVSRNVEGLPKRRADGILSKYFSEEENNASSPHT